jgi:hypothetical protein
MTVSNRRYFLEEALKRMRMTDEERAAEREENRKRYNIRGHYHPCTICRCPVFCVKGACYDDKTKEGLHRHC